MKATKFPTCKLPCSIGFKANHIIKTIIQIKTWVNKLGAKPNNLKSFLDVSA